MLSAHQQGTLRFSHSASLGAAKPDGEVWGTRQIYALDSSGFPSSASTHIMAPIMAISRYLAEGIVRGRVA